MKKTLALIILLNTLVVNAQEQYSNPILAGFYPDPSICKVGSDYYLVTSTFAYYPGLPIFHSKDLVSWKQIGYAMDRPEQLNLIGAGVSRGLFAPTIRYHKGLYYIVCTLIDRGGNYIITAKNPAGPWSNPFWLKELNGIDPSVFFDEDDNAYIVYNSVPPNNKSLYNGHRTIRMRELDYKNMKVVGEEKLLVNGGTDISKKPIWIEAPHILKKDGWYYLICAEGGTGFDHSEVVFRSKTVDGPYASFEKNPILTQRTLDPKRKNPITSTGHADFVQTDNGNWYAVFLGCRPYEGDYYNTGRETFMAPVSWENDWPTINPGNAEVQYHYPLPLPKEKSKTPNIFSGNLVFRDDFNDKSLANTWMFLRTVMEPWYSTKEKKGFLSLNVRPQAAGGLDNPSFVAHRQQHLQCIATTSMLFTPAAENEKAGLVIFQNENHFYYLCQSLEENKSVIQLYKSSASIADSNKMELIVSKEISKPVDKPVFLEIKAQKNTYSFSYSTDNKVWQVLKDGVDAKFLSTKVAGGFVGCTFGLYATSLGGPTTTKAMYDWFEYRGDDEVYKY